MILEEIAKYEDQPPFGATDKCMAAHFRQHPLGRSVLGTTRSVGALTPEQMRGYFAERYSPGNMVLVASGNIDFDRLVADAQRSCGGWAPFETRTRHAPRTSPPMAGKYCTKSLPHSNTSCRLPTDRRRKMRIDTPAGCWPRSWATIPAAACSGN